MDSFEFNKIAGGVLFALLVLFGLRNVGEILYKTEPLEHPAYAVPGGETEQAAAGAPAQTGPSFETALASADPNQGKKLANKCETCHTLNEGGPNKIGPNLYGVVGRPVASHPGFDYSDGMKKVGGDWTFDKLNHFLSGPRQFVPGTKMSFPGFSDVKDRAAVIAYLNTNGPNPQPLPKPTAQPAAPAGAAAAGAAPQGGQAAAGPGLEAQIAQADPKAGQQVANKCLTCHTLTKGGPNRIGPNLYGVVGRPVASHPGFDYSDAMKKHGGNWTLERLDQFISNPRQTVPGTKMTFVGVPQDKDRHNLLAYLHTLSDNPVPLASAPAPAAAPAQGGGQGAQQGGQSMGGAGAPMVPKAENPASGNAIIAPGKGVPSGDVGTNVERPTGPAGTTGTGTQEQKQEERGAVPLKEAIPAPAANSNPGSMPDRNENKDTEPKGETTVVH